MSENRNEWPPDYRGVIAWLRDIATECRFKGERSEFSQLAEIFRLPIAEAPAVVYNRISGARSDRRGGLRAPQPAD